MNNKEIIRPSFYTILWYPIPKDYQTYLHISEISHIHNHWITKDIINNMPLLSSTDSYKIPNPLISNYIDILKKRWRLRQTIPCISQVYLCNSMSFNALHDGSDIDICIITKPWYLRFARVWSWIFLRIYDLQRSSGKNTMNQHGKFCLSFYIDGNHTDISHLRKNSGDIYLSYRLAHCILYYTDETLPDDHLFTTNKKLLSYVPNHPIHQTIILWTPLIIWRSHFKKIIEYFSTNLIGRILQQWIATLRSHIISFKKQSLWPHTKSHIVVSDTMLKFHEDKRTLIQHKRKSRWKQA